MAFRAHKRRQQLDRCRFEAAHLKYASLQMATWYPKAISYNCVKVEGDIMDTLNEITPALFLGFEENYAGKVQVKGEEFLSMKRGGKKPRTVASKIQSDILKEKRELKGVVRKNPLHVNLLGTTGSAILLCEFGKWGQELWY